MSDPRSTPHQPFTKENAILWLKALAKHRDEQMRFGEADACRAIIGTISALSENARSDDGEDESLLCPEGFESDTGHFDPAGYDKNDCAGCGCAKASHASKRTDKGVSAKPRLVGWLHQTHPTAHIITARVKELWLACNPEQVENYTVPVYLGESLAGPTDAEVLASAPSSSAQPTPDWLFALEKLEMRATPGPWEPWRSGNSPLADGTLVGQSELRPVPRPFNRKWIGYDDPLTALTRHHTTILRDEDADFIAGLRNAWPKIKALAAMPSASARTLSDDDTINDPEPLV